MPIVVVSVISLILVLSNQSKKKAIPIEVLKVSLESIPKDVSVSNFSDINSFNILTAIHLSLLSTNYRNDLFSGAAKSWSVSKDKKKYNFALDLKLFFSDTVSFSCADVNYTFKKILQRRVTPLAFELIKTYRCLSEATFEIELHQPSTTLLNSLAHLDTSVLSVNNKEDQDLIGLGPYMYNFRDKRGVNLQRKVTHRKLTQASPQKITFILNEGLEHTLSKFKNLEIDVLEFKGQIPDNFSDRIVTARAVSRVWYLGWGDNINLPIEFKRCLYNFIDRKLLRDSMIPYQNQYEQAFGIVSPYMGGRVTANVLQRVDLKKCQYGRQIEMIAMSSTSDRLLNEVKNQFRAIGIQLKIEKLRKTELLKKIMTRKYQMTLVSFGTDQIPEQTLFYFYSKNSPVPIIANEDRTYQEDLEQIEKNSNSKDRHDLINKFEIKMASSPLIIPVLFEKQAYLVQDCIDSSNMATAGTMNYNLLEGVPDCVSSKTNK